MYILKIRFPFMAFYFCADFPILMRADIYLTIRFRFTEFDFGADIRTFVFIRLDALALSVIATAT